MCFDRKPFVPRKLLKRLVPHRRVREHPSLRLFGTAALHANLWHLNRRSVARAFAIGLFCALLPIPGQMLVAAGLAILFAANLPLSVTLVWITNPLTIPPIFLTCYAVGRWILGNPPYPLEFRWNFEWIMDLPAIALPLLVGSLVCGLLAALVGYAGASWFWRWYVVRIWRTRHKERIKHALHLD